jgi:hypothetical protein
VLFRFARGRSVVVLRFPCILTKLNQTIQTWPLSTPSMESLWRRMLPSFANAPRINNYIAFPHQFLNRDLKRFVRVHQLERLCHFWRMVSPDFSADIGKLSNKNPCLWGDCDHVARRKPWDSRLLQRVAFQLKTL